MKKITPKSRQLRNQNKGEENKKPFFSKSNDATVQTKSKQPFFQTKLTVGQPGDKYEQEADAVAEQVVNKKQRPQDLNNNTPTIQEKEISPIQRYATNAKEDELGTNTQRIEKDKEIQEKPIQKMEGEEEESLQMQAEEEEEPIQMQEEEEEPIQMQEEEEELQMQAEEEEEELQPKSNSTANNSASPQVAKQLRQSKGGGSALPKSTRAEMESSFGVDFSQVKIHTDGKAERMNQDLGAQAFAHGQDVYFNQNKFSPESREGKRLLAHELTHVVQQGGALKQINFKENSVLQRQVAEIETETASGPSPRELFAEARNHYDNGNYEEAINGFQMLLHNDEFMQSSGQQLSFIAYNIGLASMKLGRVATANFYFGIYQRHHPDSEEAAARIEEARQRMGMNSSEVTGMEGTDEERARRLFRRASTHYENGNYITAIILFERSRILANLPPEQNSQILYNIGIANLRLGRDATALTYLEAYRRYHPDDADAEQKLRELQQRMGMIE